MPPPPLRSQRTRRITEVGVGVALSTVLSLVVVYRLPQGGSISLGSMVPLWVLARRHGVGTGVLAGALHGLLQGAMGTVVHPLQGLLDYPLAYAVLGLAGWRTLAWPLAVLGGLVLRLACHLGAAPFFLGAAGAEGPAALPAVLAAGLAYNLPVLVLESLPALGLWRWLVVVRPELDLPLGGPAGWTSSDKVPTI